MNEITYRQEGDYLIPNIGAPELPEHIPLGKYGRMRRQYLMDHRPILWERMLLNGTLFLHLYEVDRLAYTRLDYLIPELAEKAGATDTLKATDQMRWVGLMNACKAQAEEIIMTELIYT